MTAKRLYIYISSAFILSCCTEAFAQALPVSDEVIDCTKVVDVVEDIAANEDTITKEEFLSSVSFLIDYGKIAELALRRGGHKFELATQVEFWNKLFIGIEYGTSVLQPTDGYTNANYNAEGNYYRIGLGYKLDMNPKNNLYFSVRYGAVSFSDKGQPVINSQSTIYDAWTGDEFSRSGLTASWYEFVMSTESLMIKNIYLGAHFRLRFLRGLQQPDSDIPTYSIPGYGRAFDNSLPAFNLYIKYVIDFRNK